MTNMLIEQYEAKRLSHAILLLTDPSTARVLVAELIAKSPLNPADYLLYAESEPLKVTDARTIRRFMEKSRFTSPIKLVFIADASQLTPEAANALLKVLEEPPIGSHFILATSRPDSILATVRSRCQIMRVNQSTSLLANQFTSKLEPMSLAEFFALAKELAVTDTPLPTLLDSWLCQTDNRAWQQVMLDFLGPAHTSVNRRLLLDNLFLELYNTG